MRAAFSDALVRLATADPKVVLLTGDHGYALFDAFRAHCPRQYINAGIAEQNMVGMAAGMARAGFRPFVYGLSAFVPVRVVEQIKLDVAHDELPVVFVGDGAGFVYSHLGTSHQSTEDIACTRAIPNLSILSPADRFELIACMDHAYARRGPVYLRMGKADRGDVHPERVELDWGKLACVRSGEAHAPALVATGSMVRSAVMLAQIHFPAAAVWSVPFLKPFDVVGIASLANESTGIVTLEEHSILGGLGAAVAEASAATTPTRVLRLGVKDRFSEHCGTYDYLLREHGLDVETMRAAIAAFFPER